MFTADKTGLTIQRLPIERIARDPDQARSRFSEGALIELAESIRVSGVIQPVVVTGDAEQGYRLLAGERRWRAAQRVGLTELPAIVRNDLDPEQAGILGLIENLQRESLGVMDTAHGLARLGARHALTHDEIAHRIGKSRVYVTNFLRLRQLSPAVQAMLEDGRLSVGHGKILAGLDAATQDELARRVVAKGASVRQLERWTRPQNTPSSKSSEPDADMTAMEQRLSEALGNTVRLSFDPDRRRGEMRIAFHDLDEFEGVLARLGLDDESSA